jgi:hypothetical protein
VPELDCIYSAEVTGDKLKELGIRGHEVIENRGLVFPIRCSLHSAGGERLASWVLGVGDDGTTNCQHDMEQRWEKSAHGVTLLLQDAAGEVAEVSLIVGPPRRTEFLNP